MGGYMLALAGSTIVLQFFFVYDSYLQMSEEGKKRYRKEYLKIIIPILIGFIIFYLIVEFYTKPRFEKNRIDVINRISNTLVIPGLN